MNPPLATLHTLLCDAPTAPTHKLSIVNGVLRAAHASSAWRCVWETSGCVALYPQLLLHCAPEMSDASPAALPLMQQCLESVHTFLLTLLRWAGEASVKAQDVGVVVKKDKAVGVDDAVDVVTTLLGTLNQIVKFIVHPHPMVCHFFRTVWLRLATLESDAEADALISGGEQQGGGNIQTQPRRLERWCVDVCLQALLQAHIEQQALSDVLVAPQYLWCVNGSQSQLIQLLADMLPSMNAHNQMHVFRHFNLLLRPVLRKRAAEADMTWIMESSIGGGGSGGEMNAAHHLSPAVLSALLLSVDISALCAPVQMVLYTHTFPYALEEVTQIKQQDWHRQLNCLPLLLVCVEVISACFRNNVVMDELRGRQEELATQACPLIRDLFISLCSSLSALHAHSPPAPAARMTVLRALTQALASDALNVRMKPVGWCAIISALVTASTGAHALNSRLIRPLLGDALVHLGMHPLKPGDETNTIFLHTFKPAFKELLQPKDESSGSSSPGEGGGGAGTSSPTPSPATSPPSQSSDVLSCTPGASAYWSSVCHAGAAGSGSAANVNQHAFACFLRFSALCPAHLRVRLRDLIPPAVHPRLVEFGRSVRGKSIIQQCGGNTASSAAAAAASAANADGHATNKNITPFVTPLALPRAITLFARSGTDGAAGTTSPPPPTSADAAATPAATPPEVQVAMEHVSACAAKEEERRNATAADPARVRYQHQRAWQLHCASVYAAHESVSSHAAQLNVEQPQV